MMMLKQHMVIQYINPYLYDESRDEIKRIDISINKRISMEYNKRLFSEPVYRAIRYMYKS